MTTLLNWMGTLDRPNVDYRWHDPHKLNGYKVRGCGLLLSAMIFKDDMDDIYIHVLSGNKPNDVLVFVNFGDASQNDFPVERQKIYSFETGKWEQITL